VYVTVTAPCGTDGSQANSFRSALAPVDRLTSAGRATQFTEIAILDDGGTSLPEGEVGEICVKGDYLMSRYYKDPDATAEVSRFGWHHTGDLGYLDGDRYLHIVDRKKDMIISGGFNVYSAEVERALAQHPAVVESAVVGIPDAHWG
jgi:fatty-acyl-CoA synthase